MDKMEKRHSGPEMKKVHSLILNIDSILDKYLRLKEHLLSLGENQKKHSPFPGLQPHEVAEG